MNLDNNKENLPPLVRLKRRSRINKEGRRVSKRIAEGRRRPGLIDLNKRTVVEVQKVSARVGKEVIDLDTSEYNQDAEMLPADRGTDQIGGVDSVRKDVVRAESQVYEDLTIESLTGSQQQIAPPLRYPLTPHDRSTKSRLREVVRERLRDSGVSYISKLEGVERNLGIAPVSINSPYRRKLTHVCLWCALHSAEKSEYSEFSSVKEHWRNKHVAQDHESSVSELLLSDLMVCVLRNWHEFEEIQNSTAIALNGEKLSPQNVVQQRKRKFFIAQRTYKEKCNATGANLLP